MPSCWSKRLVGGLVAAVLGVGLPANAGTVVSGVSGDGWCKRGFGCDNTNVRAFNNTFAGYDGTNYENDWFAVDVPVVTGTIAAASLTIWNDASNRPGSVQNMFYLTHASGFTYDLLATGPILGSIDLTSADTFVSHYVTIALNSTALGLLTAAQGTNFVFGGAAPTGGEIFGYTTGMYGNTLGAPPAYLTLTTANVAAVPEPASLALLGLGVMGLGLLRRRRATMFCAGALAGTAALGWTGPVQAAVVHFVPPNDTSGYSFAYLSNDGWSDGRGVVFATTADTKITGVGVYLNVNNLYVSYAVEHVLSLTGQVEAGATTLTSGYTLANTHGALAFVDFAFP